MVIGIGLFNLQGDILLSSAPLEGYAKTGIAALIAGVASTTWSYDGMGAACYMSGEIKNPKKEYAFGSYSYSSYCTSSLCRINICSFWNSFY